MDALSVAEVGRVEQLEDLRSRWSALLAQTPEGSFFQSLDWLLAYWRHFGAGQRLRVLAVSHHGDLRGLVPLVVRREKTRLGTMRVLTYPLQDWGSYYGPIGADPAATLRAAMQHVARTRRDWDLLDLRWIDEEIDRGGAAAALAAAGFAARSGVWDATCLLDLPITWEAYAARLSGKFRNNLRRAEKRVAQAGSPTFERYRPRGAAFGDDDPRWDLYDECVALAGRSWQGASNTGTTLCHPQVADFFRQTHAAAARRGALDLVVLRLDGWPVAFGYNYHAGGTVYGLRTGYDPHFAECGVGSVLLAWTLRDSIARGDRRFDLGVAAKAVKQRWSPRLAPIGRLTHYPASLRAQLLAWKHRLQGAS